MGQKKTCTWKWDMTSEHDELFFQGLIFVWRTFYFDSIFFVEKSCFTFISTFLFLFHSCRIDNIDTIIFFISLHRGHYIDFQTNKSFSLSKWSSNLLYNNKTFITFSGENINSLPYNICQGGIAHITCVNGKVRLFFVILKINKRV